MADAVLIERHYPAGMTEDARLKALSDEFGPVLGAKRAWVRHVHLGRAVKDLLTAAADSPAYYFPSVHPRSGEDRYSWSDRGDGVLYGTLAPDQVDPAEIAKLQAEKREEDNRKAEAFLATPEGRKFQGDRLLKQGIIDEEEYARMLATGSIHGEVANA